MLVHLRMQNIALIDDVSLDFDEGLIVLTGETGAGKSILLDGMNLALGTRAQRELLRPEEGPSQVDLLFTADSPRLKTILSSMGISSEDGEVLLTRSFSESGRSVCRINGQVATASQLKEAAKALIDIHGQHEHQSLLDPASHRIILDRFDDRIQESLHRYQELFDTYQAVQKELEGYLKDEQDKERLLSLMQYERDEIEQAHWTEGEEETLLATRRRLYNSERMQNAVQEAAISLTENEGASCAADQISTAIRALSSIRTMDEEKLGPMLSSLEDAAAILDEIGYQLHDYLEDLEMDPSMLKEVEERLEIIRRIQSKYGRTVGQVETYYQSLLEKIDKLENIQRTKEELTVRKNAVEKKLAKEAGVLKELRRKAAEAIGKEVTGLLETLQFGDPLFVVEIKDSEQYHRYGTETIEFRIRTNVGDQIKPLHMIASGGEMSRIMLAIKTVLARKDEIPTLIFDEIDAGISGRTAQSVAEKMAQIARFHQVLCVTHLPQIAAMADHHFEIEKQVKDGRTHTIVHPLDHEKMIQELARLTGGTSITEQVLASAREMKEQADQWKQSLKEATV